MNNANVEIFKPGIATLREIAAKHRGLEIKGLDDKEGYDAVKAARKELGDWRILITKEGKKYREEALAYQREVLRQEKEHLAEIVPVEDELKAKLEAIDDERKREERRALLPSRKTMLAEIEVALTDEEILDFDENSFATFYGNARMNYLEAKNRAAQEELDKKRREEELAKAKEEAAARAVEEERTRAERAKAAEEKRQADEAARKKADEERQEREKAAEVARQEKNRRYRAWLKENGVTDENKAEFHIEREDIENQDGSKKQTTFTLYKKVGEITIK